MDLIHPSVCWMLNIQQNPFAVNSHSNPSFSLRRSLIGRREGGQKGKRESRQTFKPGWDFTKSSRPCVLRSVLRHCSHSFQGGQKIITQVNPTPSRLQSSDNCCLNPPAARVPRWGRLPLSPFISKLVPSLYAFQSSPALPLINFLN